MKVPGRQLTLGLLIITAFMVLIRTTSARKGCGSFGHSCYGGHGKRADLSQRSAKFPDNLADDDEIGDGNDSDALTFLREYCSVEPQYYFRLVPVLRKLATVLTNIDIMLTPSHTHVFVDRITNVYKTVKSHESNNNANTRVKRLYVESPVQLNLDLSIQVHHSLYL